MHYSEISFHIEDILSTLSAGMVPEARGEIISLRRQIRRAFPEDSHGINGVLVAARAQLDGRPGGPKLRKAGDLLRSLWLRQAPDQRADG